jgi:hypothetical protein
MFAQQVNYCYPIMLLPVDIFTGGYLLFGHYVTKKSACGDFLTNKNLLFHEF